MLNMSEQLKIKRRIDHLINSEDEVSQDDVDDAFLYASSTYFHKEKVKYSLLKRRFDIQQDEIAARTPVPKAELITKEEVEAAFEERRKHPTLKNRAKFALLNREYAEQREHNEEARELRKEDKANQ